MCFFLEMISEGASGDAISEPIGEGIGWIDEGKEVAALLVEEDTSSVLQLAVCKNMTC